MNSEPGRDRLEVELTRCLVQDLVHHGAGPPSPPYGSGFNEAVCPEYSLAACYLRS